MTATFPRGGEDHLIGGGWESHLYGGAGEDRFELGANAWVEDGETVDRVSCAGWSM